MGLSLSYALPLTGLLNGLLTSSAETEQEMVAVERVLEYSSLQPEVLAVPDHERFVSVPLLHAVAPLAMVFCLQTFLCCTYFSCQRSS